MITDPIGVLEKLRKYIQEVDVTRYDVPMGLVFPESGEYVRVNYSLSNFNRTWPNTHSAINHIAEFLDERL